MSLENIKRLKEAGLFSALDIQMAGLVSRIEPEADDLLIVACALASRATRGGHVCVDLAEYAGKSWADLLKKSLPVSRENEASNGSDDLEPNGPQRDLGNLPALEAWKKALKAPVVGNGAETGENRTILVLKGSRLYLRRYWDYERKVEDALKRLNVNNGIKADGDRLDRYFDEPGSDEQKGAARNAIERRLSLLSGGPGTGKTHTLARAVALLAEMKKKEGRSLIVHLVAPTGKAAVRMVESIKKAKKRLLEAGIDKNIVDKIPEEASTIHRLLKPQYHSPYFKHEACNLLTADMVIVDEASMVDLPLMAKLVDALPKECSLMLVGDIDQLASVEPGRVYGDVCLAARKDGPLAGCLCHLTRSRRFPETSAIGTVSRMINAGDDGAWDELQKSRDSQYLEVADSATLLVEKGRFRMLVEEKMAGFLAAKDHADALKAINNFRILCALREGPYGVRQLNRRVEKILSEKGLNPVGRFYDHQLIMIKVNTPALQLYNGDVGVVLAKDGAGKKDFVAWFPASDEKARSVPVTLLPEHETAFAMTIHKSQGSEFPHVALILPDTADSLILTRELLYTGMTRVQIDEEKQTGKLSMWCTEASFRKAAGTKTVRTTGLFAEHKE